jgi:hypothetical protein
MQINRNNFFLPWLLLGFYGSQIYADQQNIIANEHLHANDTAVEKLSDQLISTKNQTVGDVLIALSEQSARSHRPSRQSVEKFIKNSTDPDFLQEFAGVMRAQILDQVQRHESAASKAHRSSSQQYNDRYLALASEILAQEVTVEALQQAQISAFQNVLTQSEVDGLLRLSEMPEWKIYQRKQRELTVAMMQGGVDIGARVGERFELSLAALAKELQLQK